MGWTDRGPGRGGDWPASTVVGGCHPRGGPVLVLHRVKQGSAGALKWARGYPVLEWGKRPVTLGAELGGGDGLAAAKPDVGPVVGWPGHLGALRSVSDRHVERHWLSLLGVRAGWRSVDEVVLLERQWLSLLGVRAGWRCVGEVVLLVNFGGEVEVLGSAGA